METGLSVIETTSAVQLFSPGVLDPIIGRIEREAKEEATKLDISTVAGRKAIASLSFNVAKSKTYIDGKRKELVADEKKRLAAIDAEGRKVWNRLEALQEEIRKPLTDWEEADKKRVAALEFKVLTMSELGSIPYGATTADIEARIAEVDALDMSNMQEFTSRAELVEKQTRERLATALAESQKRDAEAAENARLRAEAAVREQKERDERIAQKAQWEAEAERKRVEEEKFAAEARAKQAEAQKAEAEARAKQAEAQKAEAEAKAKRDAEEAEKRHQSEKEAEEKRHAEAIAAAAKKAEDDRIAAEEKAKRDAEAAVAAEQARVAAEAKRAEEEAVAREKDKKHKATINSAAVHALAVNCYITEENAKLVITAIAKGKIPNVKISY